MTVVKQAIEDIMNAGFTVIEHHNNSGNGETNHLTIVGGRRKVDFWPTTGTVFAPKEAKLSTYRLRSASVKVAINLARFGSL